MGSDLGRYPPNCNSIPLGSIEKEHSHPMEFSSVQTSKARVEREIRGRAEMQMMRGRKFLDARQLWRARKRGKWRGKFMENLCAARGWVSSPSFLPDQNNLILSLTLSIVFPSFHGRPMHRCGFEDSTPIDFQSSPHAPLDKESRMSWTKPGILIFFTMIPFPPPYLIVIDIHFKQIFATPVETVHPKF